MCLQYNSVHNWRLFSLRIKTTVLFYVNFCEKSAKHWLGRVSLKPGIIETPLNKLSKAIIIRKPNQINLFASWLWLATTRTLDSSSSVLCSWMTLASIAYLLIVIGYHYQDSGLLLICPLLLIKAVLFSLPLDCDWLPLGLWTFPLLFPAPD